MRFLSLAVASMGALTLALGAEKPAAPVSSEDETLVLTAFPCLEKACIIKAVGEDPGMELVVIDVKLAPRADNKVVVSLDDFTLISRKDGQRSQPLAPSQIAGTGALVVSQDGRGGGIGMMNPGRRGPIWGGVPGTGSRPRRIGGDDTGAVTAAGSTEAKATVTNSEQPNPLMATLKEKSLPEKETTETVTGLLYFFLEGKHKLKDLELMYKSPAGRMILDFQK